MAKKPSQKPLPAWAANRPAFVPAVMLKAALGLGALVFLMFADVLLSPGGTALLGNRGTDMFAQFYSWREFGFGQLAHGNLPLWNPHVFSGAPFFGGSQGAMLYPTNWPLLFVPLAWGINASIALNVWLLGLFMYAWGGYRGLRPLAGFVSAVVVMFCGPHFMHIYSGHPVHMAAMSWAPAIFLALDGVFFNATQTGNRWRAMAGWTLFGMASVCLQIFAGHPQYLFFTAIAAGFYTLWGMGQVFMSRRAEGPGILRGMGVPAVALGAMFAGGSLLGAIQLFTSVQSNGETIRSVPVPFEFAAMFGFPPENLLTLLNPYLFGDMHGMPYWGRCYLWEMSLFIGVVALALAIYGAFFACKATAQNGGDTASPEGPARLHRPARLVAIVVITFIFALGVHTPLFQFLYDYVPGFGKFRGISKFTYQTALFLSLLAGVGFDALLRHPAHARRIGIGAGVAGVVVLFAAGVCALMDPFQWRGILQAIGATRESYLPPAAFESLPFAGKAGAFAAGSLVLPGLVLLLAAACCLAWNRWKHAAQALTLLIVAETFLFALHTRETFDLRLIDDPGVVQFLKEHPGDVRSINLLNANSAVSMEALDLWGSDPGIERRYAEFIIWSQGGDPNRATQYVNFAQLDPLYAMLRLRYAFVPTEKGVQAVTAPTPPMERVQLITAHRVIPERDAMFKAMREPGFDPRREVLLESDPGIPGGGIEVNAGVLKEDRPAGTVRLTGTSTDWLEVDAEVTVPSVLLITDAWSPAWRARDVSGDSPAKPYQLLPANYMLRAVPLTAGRHRVRIEYAPSAYTLGKRVSAVAWLAFLGAAVALRRAGAARRP